MADSSLRTHRLGHWVEDEPSTKPRGGVVLDLLPDLRVAELPAALVRSRGGPPAGGLPISPCVGPRSVSPGALVVSSRCLAMGGAPPACPCPGGSHVSR